MNKKQLEFESFMKSSFPDQSLTITYEFPRYASYTTFMAATIWDHLYREEVSERDKSRFVDLWDELSPDDKEYIQSYFRGVR